MDQGITFSGNCLNAAGSQEVIFTNEMRNCYDGITLENVGKIGQQGASGFPSDNLWSQTGGWTWNSQAYSRNSPGASSNFFVQGGSGYTPNPNSSNNGFVNQILLTTTTGTRPFCAPCVGNCNSLMTLTSTLQEMIQQQEPNLNLKEENEWLNKKYALEQLLYHAALDTLSDSLLVEFTDSAKYTNLGNVVETEQLLKIQDYMNAKIATNNLTPENQLEVNFKLFNSLYADWQMNPLTELSANQMEDLWYVAFQCYHKGGDAVLQARSFLNYLYATQMVYPNNCEAPVDFSARQAIVFKNNASKSRESAILQNRIVLNPNPAKDLINFITPENFGSFELNFYNSIGVNVFTKAHVSSNEPISVSKLTDGIYSYCIKKSDGKPIIGKFIICK